MNDKKNTYLLIKLDELSFFTHIKNFPQLVEFGKNFGAEISVVESTAVTPLDLEDLAKQICTGTATDKPEYTVVEVKLKGAETTNINIRAKYHIKNKLLNRGSISYKDLASKFPDITLEEFNKMIEVIIDEMKSSGNCVLKKENDCYLLQEVWNNPIWTDMEWKKKW